MAGERAGLTVTQVQDLNNYLRLTNFYNPEFKENLVLDNLKNDIDDQLTADASFLKNLSEENKAKLIAALICNDTSVIASLLSGFMPDAKSENLAKIAEHESDYYANQGLWLNLIVTKLIESMLSGPDGTSYSTEKKARILQQAMQFIPESNLSTHEKIMLCREIDAEAETLVSDYAYHESLPPLEKNKYAGDITLPQYLSAMGRPEVDPSEFIILTTSLLQTLCKEQEGIQEDLNAVRQLYLDNQYERAIDQLEDISHARTKHIEIAVGGYTSLNDFISDKLENLSRVQLEKNEGRRFFENRLAQLYSAESIDLKAVDKIAKNIIKADVVTPFEAMQAILKITVPVQLDEALMDRAAQLKLDSALYKTKDRMVKPTLKSKVEEALDEESASVFTRNLGVMKSTTPNFYDERGERDMRNRIVDAHTTSGVPEGYSSAHPEVVFAGSLSGTIFEVVVALEKYMQENRSDPNLEKDINQFIKAVITTYINYGYHSFLEIVDVLKEPTIQAIFEANGVALDMTFPESVVENAFKDTQEYTKAVALKKAMHNELLSSSKLLTKKVAVESLPYIPKTVFLDHVGENGKLLTDTQIKAVAEELKGQPDGRYSKSIGGSEYSLMRAGGENYTVYWGTRHPGAALGEGSYGKVKLAQRHSDGKWFALKVQAEQEETPGLIRESAVKEHAILDRLGKTPGPLVDRKKEGKPEKYSILMELGEGPDLETFITSRLESKAKVPAILWLDMVIGALESVDDMHKKGVLHRDLKLTNFIYDLNREKVIPVDFGFAEVRGSDGAVVGYYAGTPDYMAPELQEDKECVYNEATEVYALGIMCKEILGFVDETVPGEEDLVENDTIFINNSAIKLFLNRMIAKDPEDRPPLKEAIAFFETIRQDMLPLLTMNVGVINVKDFLAADEKQRAELISNLKKFDEILLGDTTRFENSDPKDIINVVRALQANGIIVQDNLLRFPNFEGLVDFASHNSYTDVGERHIIRLYTACPLPLAEEKKEDVQSDLPSPRLHMAINAEEEPESIGPALTIGIPHEDAGLDPEEESEFTGPSLTLITGDEEVSSGDVEKSIEESMRQPLQDIHWKEVVKAFTEEQARLQTKSERYSHQGKSVGYESVTSRNKEIAAVFTQLNKLQKEGNLTYNLLDGTLEKLNHSVITSKQKKLGSTQAAFFKSPVSSRVIDKLRTDISEQVKSSPKKIP